VRHLPIRLGFALLVALLGGGVLAAGGNGTALPYAALATGGMLALTAIIDRLKPAHVSTRPDDLPGSDDPSTPGDPS